MARNTTKTILIFISAAILLAVTGCEDAPPSSPPATTQPDVETPDRESLVPVSQLKITPDADLYPPQSHSPEYAQPVPLPYPVNTAGAEDSAFILPDGNTLYFWFTPDPNALLAQQLDDGVTGIWASYKNGDGWQEPERVLLVEPDARALDGCAFVMDGTMWFCSARAGYAGMGWFTADNTGGEWSNWQPAGFPADYEVGELHITADGQEMYFHSARTGGLGQFDIWVCRWENSAWSAPQNVTAVNSPQSDGWPFISPNGDELWITRTYQGSPALFRSLKVSGQWQEPELIISQFAGEAAVDSVGNVYFTHHFYQDGVALEADIYVAYKIVP